MFERFRKHRRILVTGPHRSGTRIAARMIAADTGHHYVDETEVWDSWVGVQCWHEMHGPVVIHGPLLLLTLEHHAAEIDLVVWMFRSFDAIVASMKRIQMQPSVEEVLAWHRAYGAAPNQTELTGIDALLQLKANAWYQCIRPRLELTVPVHTQYYDDLADHPLWLSADQRAHLQWNQTAADDAGAQMDRARWCLQQIAASDDIGRSQQLAQDWLQNVAPQPQEVST